MSTPSLNIQAYGTSSSLVPGSIQNSRNNNLEILTVVQTIPTNVGGTQNLVTPLVINANDLAGKEIVGSSAEFSGTTTGNVSIGANTPADLLAAAIHDNTQNEPLLATLSDSIGPVGGINVTSDTSSTDFTLTLRLILRKL